MSKGRNLITCGIIVFSSTVLYILYSSYFLNKNFLDNFKTSYKRREPLTTENVKPPLLTKLVELSKEFSDYDVGNMHFNVSAEFAEKKLAVIVPLKNCLEEVRIF